MAGIGTAGQAVVMISGLRLYLLLAAASFVAALFWRQTTPKLLKSEEIVMHFYRFVVGDLDGRSCGSYPVWSSYAAQAFSKHGLFFGSWLTIDWLMHEAGDMKHCVWIKVD